MAPTAIAVAVGAEVAVSGSKKDEKRLRSEAVEKIESSSSDGGGVVLLVASASFWTTSTGPCSCTSAANDASDDLDGAESDAGPDGCTHGEYGCGDSKGSDGSVGKMAVVSSICGGFGIMRDFRRPGQ